MARLLYVNADPAAQTRATQLGCGWLAAVPGEYAAIAVAPCAIIAGSGQVVVLEEPTTPQAVAAAAQPFLDADTAAQARAATQQANIDTLTSRAQNALIANAAFQALASPTNAQTLAQVQLLTKECNALIRLALNLADTISGT